MDSRLIITREQLATFLGNNQDLIIRFERLLESVGSDIPTFLDEINASIVSVEAGNKLALAGINNLANAIEGLSLTPSNQPIRKELDFVPVSVPERQVKEGLIVSSNLNIPQLRAVSFAGVGANNTPLVSLYINNLSNPEDAIGLTVTPISNGTGRIAVNGEIATNLNTTGLNTGAVYTNGTTGEIGNATLTPSNNRVRIGYCLNVDANNGVIYIDISWNDSILTLQDTDISTPNDGDLLIYDNDKWTNKAGGSTGTFTNNSGNTLTFENGLITGVV